ncbi:MAG: hypothetical protein LBC12_03950 [Nitrososphaerota archaeon]|jgi:hypothetical protein|nr:hypothetical protein [Nitrososphaerota archaeon]
MMNEKEYAFTAINMKKEFMERIKDFIKNHPEFGYRSAAQFLEDASRRHYEELQKQIKKQPRFEQINTDENGTKILDRYLHEVIQIYIKPHGITCDFDQTDKCDHIEYALTIQEIKDIIKQRKKECWQLPDI